MIRLNERAFAVRLNDDAAAVRADGGAVVWTPGRLVRYLTGRRVVSKGNHLAALSALQAHPAFAMTDRPIGDDGPTFFTAPADKRPTERYQQALAARVRWFCAAHFCHEGPITIARLGRVLDGRGDDREGENLLGVSWSWHALAALGWRPATCPPGVQRQHVAWYPPAPVVERSPLVAASADRPPV